MDAHEIIARLERIEVSIAGFRRDQAHVEEGLAEQGLRIDRLRTRIERIEHRQELSE
jgi:hypothetical protein